MSLIRSDKRSGRAVLLGLISAEQTPAPFCGLPDSVANSGTFAPP